MSPLRGAGPVASLCGVTEGPGCAGRESQAPRSGAGIETIPEPCACWSGNQDPDALLELGVRAAVKAFRPAHAAAQLCGTAV